MDPSYVPKILQLNKLWSPTSWKKNHEEDESKVAVLYSGGTIGMVPGDDGGRLLNLPSYVTSGCLELRSPLQCKRRGLFYLRHPDLLQLRIFLC